MKMIKKIHTLDRTNWFVKNDWSLPHINEIEREINWRVLTNWPPKECILYGFHACLYYDIRHSTRDQMVITLPEDFDPQHFSWPVTDIGVALVETGVYEDELLELCREYQADHVILQGHAKEPREFKIRNVAKEAA